MDELAVGEKVYMKGDVYLWTVLDIVDEYITICNEKQDQIRRYTHEAFAKDVHFKPKTENNGLG